MGKFLRLIIMAVILLGFNFKVHAELVVESNGRVRVSTGGFNQNGVRTWRYLDNGRGGMGGNMFYHENSSKSLAVRDVSTGFRSASTVPVTLEARVSRKAVLSGAFNLVKRGAALGTRLSGWGTAAYFAYEAYQAVNPSLESAGYEYSQEQGEFIKGYPDALCLKDRAVNSCVGIDSSIIKAKNKGGQSAKEAEELMRMLVEKDFQKTSKIIIEDRYKGAYFQFCFFIGSGVSCQISTGTRFWYGSKNGLHSETLTEEKFLEIATPSIDGNPTPFVEGTGKPEYKENIKVPAGTVVTIGPVTPENGKPVQITITFGQDSNGNTTANVATTQRPDLTPGGSEAPNTKPDSDPAPNPDGKPDKKPDDKPDKRPDDKPDPDDDPSDKDKRKEDKKDDKKEESKGLLCNIFPDILACSEKGDVEEQEEPFKIPHTNNDTTFSPDFFLPDNGVCPAPRTATYLGITMEFKYDMICNFAEMIRFLVIGIAAVAAAYIMFSSRKD